MFQPSPNIPCTEPNITVGGEILLWQISSLTLVAFYQGQSPPMKRSTTELHVQVWFLADDMPMCGKEEVSD